MLILIVRETLHVRASYLRDAVFGANDGVVTTFAVVAGSAGAMLGSSVVLILGFANLFADGFSMAAGTYLGVKSEIEFEESGGSSKQHEGSPVKHGVVTFISFNLAGLIPLMPFLFKLEHALAISTVLVGLTLFGVGLMRGAYTKKHAFISGVEVLLVGGFAAIVAYGIGFIVHKYVI